MSKYFMADLNKYRQEGLKEILEILESVFSQTGIDFYYLIGAIARDIWFSQERISSRTTRDMDFAIMVSDIDQFKETKQILIEQHGFTTVSWNEFTLQNQGITIDLLPFGALEVMDGVTIQEGIGMHHIKVNGFKEIAKAGTMPYTTDDKTFQVATLPSIILLKLIAYDDRPEKRQKDPADIAGILSAYFEIEQNLFFDTHYDLLDQVDEGNELISAKLIGRQIKYILIENDFLKERLINILNKHIADSKGNRFVEIMATTLDQSVEKVLVYLHAMLGGILDDKVVNE